MQMYSEDQKKVLSQFWMKVKKVSICERHLKVGVVLKSPLKTMKRRQKRIKLDENAHFKKIRGETWIKMLGGNWSQQQFPFRYKNLGQSKLA